MPLSGGNFCFLRGLKLRIYHIRSVRGFSITSINNDISNSSSCFTPRVNRPSLIRWLGPQKVSYQEAASIQEEYVRHWLDFKAGKFNEPEKSNQQKLEPTIFTFEMNPVYTCGRRQRGNLTESEIEFFRAGGNADFIEAARGGQTTFHGPGQLVAYPIVDLKQYGIPVRCYVSLLEKAIINTLAHYDLKGKTTNDTGVWMNDHEKIAAIGIHVRRSITSHGIALNVFTDTWWFNRIVACGLPDKTTTTMAQQGVNTSVDEVAQVFSEKLATLLGSQLVKLETHN